MPNTAPRVKALAELLDSVLGNPGKSVSAVDRVRLFADGDCSFEFYMEDAQEVVNLLDRVAAELRAALEPQEAEPVAWAYEFHDFGSVWKRHVILNRPDGGASPPTKHCGSAVRNVCPLFAVPASEKAEQLSNEPRNLGKPLPNDPENVPKNENIAPASEKAASEVSFMLRDLIERAQELIPLTYVNWHDSAKVALSQPVQGWQTMDSAPRDGSAFMVYVAQSDLGPHWFAPVSRTLNGEWWDDSTGEQIEPINGATHWMPLPAGPAAKEGQ